MLVIICILNILKKLFEIDNKLFYMSRFRNQKKIMLKRKDIKEYTIN